MTPYVICSHNLTNCVHALWAYRGLLTIIFAHTAAVKIGCTDPLLKQISACHSIHCSAQCSHDALRGTDF